MVHTVFCILFTLHRRPSQLMGTVVFRVSWIAIREVVMGRAGAFSWQISTNIYRNLHKKSGNRSDSSWSSQVWSRKVCCLRLLLWISNSGCSLKPRKSQKAEVKAPPPHPKTVATCSGWDLSLTGDPTVKLLRPIFFSTTQLPQDVLYCIALLRFIWFE